MKKIKIIVAMLIAIKIMETANIIEKQKTGKKKQTTKKFMDQMTW